MEPDLALKPVLVDSDVLIEVLRQRNPDILNRWADLSRGRALVLYSPVSAAEIWHGLRDSERPSVEALFAHMTCVPIDAEIGRKAGDYLRRFRPSHGLEIADALIAATAVLHTVPLWTRNKRHYPMKELRFF